MTQNINLYDPSLRAKREWLTAVNAATAVGVCTLAVVLAGAWAVHDVRTLREPATQTHTALEAAQKDLVELTQRLAQTKPDVRLQGELRAIQAAVTQRQSAFSLLQAGGLGNETGHANALNAFARQSINGLWLTGVTLDNQQLALRGRTTSPDLIPSYVNRLNKEAALQGRSFRALSIARPEQEAAASAPARSAPFVEFSLVSAHGTEAPAKTPSPEARR
ncbi:PilN domain-containing protein [Piscinibacter gummiphilus]|uniref:PilN domain-containing protein n=1 Tax=Piscinibacter gummiphilus TaxID=946333 RepID=A0ABZ0D2J4_9BURK|nr:PilN domain-containing protein [Piscinibacter gummiphilus]WOB09555.1 PilN domain-containing protein [Piscinibacter gummiphilus]